MAPADDHLAGLEETLARLDALLDNAPVGIAFFDRELRFERVNAALAAMNQRAVADHLGRTIDEVLETSGPEAAQLLAHVRDTGEPVLDVVMAGARRPGDGSRLRVVAGFYPVRVGGAVVGIGVVVRDVTAQAAAEEGRELLFHRVASLASVTTGLAVANGSREAAEVVLDEGSRALGAVAALVAMRPVGGGPVEVLGARNLPSEWAARWLDPQPPDASPHSEVLASGEPVWLSDADAVARAYPGLAADLAGLGVAAVAAVPLVADGEVIGALAFGFPEEHPFDAGEQTFLAAFTGACAAAFERARLYDRQQRARERLAFLAQASGQLVASLDWEDTLRRVTALAVPRVADLCMVFLVDDAGVPRPFDIAHRDRAHGARVRRLFERYPVDPSAPMGLGAVLRRREVMRFTMDDAFVEAVGRSEEHRTLLQEAGVDQGVLVPIVAAGRAVGVMALAVDAGRTFEEDDATLAQELAVRAAQAIGNARLFAERAHIAQVLQSSLLPRSTATVPGADVATRFVAGGEGVDVGGDFYDVFAAGDEWVVAIGDVRGKGVEAAALTATARNTIRSAALLRDGPVGVLRHLNDVLVAGTDGGTAEPRFCTAAVAYVTPGERSLAVRLVVGGHPLPYLLRTDGSARPVGMPGTLLGVLPDPELREVDVELAAGDALVFYTDGVTERHADDRFFDDEGLAAVLSRCVGFTAAALAERIETAARAFVEDELRDDLAVVVVRVPDRSTASTSASTDLPGETASARRARRFVVAALEALGVEGPRETAELLVSEVVTNAVVHGGSGVRVTVESSDGQVRVSVWDESPSVPIVRQPVPEDENGRGMFLVASLSSRWGVDALAPGKSVWFELS